MDDIALILGALAAGAAASAKETASAAVKDAYAGLKNLLQNWFTEQEKPAGEMILAEYENKPESWEAPLTDALVETEGNKAPEILQAVEVLKQALEASSEENAFSPKFYIKGSEVGSIGDHANIGTIHIGGKK